MSKLRTYTLTVLLSTLTFAPESRAATIAPPLGEQVKQVQAWFSGSFDNSQQVASNPRVPFISMSNCAVELVGANPEGETANVYVQQESTVFNRLRLYSISSDSSAVKLSIYSFLNPNLLQGLCDRPEQERSTNVSNLAATICDLSLVWEPTRYYGNNAPNGCRTSTGGKVVSEVAIWESAINSLDRIFDANGNLLVATPIEFRRTNSVPEPSISIGLVTFGIWGTQKALSGKRKQKSTKKEKVSV